MPDRSEPASDVPVSARSGGHELPGVGAGMVVRRVVMSAREVVFFKGVIEASEGLAAVYAERGGDLHVATTAERVAELDTLLDGLCQELGAMRVESR